MATTVNKKKYKAPRVFLIVMAVGVFITGMYGFGSKLEQFIRAVIVENEADFTLIPVLNYMFAAAGFLCLFGWAAKNGMFKDLEKPKYDMLEYDRELDEVDGIDWEKQA